MKVKPKKILPRSKYGIILPGTKKSPGGNEAEFPDIRNSLKKRRITWYEREVMRTSTVFWMYGSEVPKLPEDRKGIDESNSYLNYIPVDEGSGHGISNLDNFLERHPGDDGRCPK